MLQARTICPLTFTLILLLFTMPESFRGSNDVIEPVNCFRNLQHTTYVNTKCVFLMQAKTRESKWLELRPREEDDEEEAIKLGRAPFLDPPLTQKMSEETFATAIQFPFMSDKSLFCGLSFALIDCRCTIQFW